MGATTPQFCVYAGIMLKCLGALLFALVLKRVWRFVWTHVLKPRCNYAKYGAKKGAWAVVTGATDGIGLALAEGLAARGFNIVLVSRTAAKLRAAAESIVKKFAVETSVVSVDCYAPDAPATVFSATKDLDVAVLVNNVGVAPEIPALLQDMPTTSVDQIMGVNSRFLVHLSHLMLPLLKRRKHSLFVVLSSMFAVLPAPFNVPYSATKAFATSFARSLRAELEREGVDVVCVEPGFVATNMASIRKPTFMAPSPQQYAAATLDKMDAGGEISPYWPHDLMRTGFNMIPSEHFLAARIYDNMQSARKKLLARKEREANKQNN